MGEEREDFVGGQGLQFAVFEFLAEFRNGRVVGSEGVFFSNEACGTRANTRLPGRLS